MKTIKFTYKVVSKNNPFAQKTISATVNNSKDAYAHFERKVSARLGADIKFNHPGKVVVID